MRVEQGDGWTLYNADCLDVLPTLTGVDAVVTDPPYGIQAVRGGKCFSTSNAAVTNVYRPIVGDDKPFDPSPWLDYPVVVLWGANHYADRLPSRARWLVWDKRDGTGSNPLADCELAWTSDTRPARLFHHRWMGMIRASEKGPRLHPSQKPVALMRWTLETVDIPSGALVLDPYAGSGTTGVACLQTGRRFIGVEVDAGYFDTACRRIEAAAAQGRLALELEA